MNESWEFESGLPDFDVEIKDAFWKQDVRWGDAALLVLKWDAPSKDGGTYEREQIYSAGDGWNISADNNVISGRKFTRRSNFTQFAAAAGEVYPELKNEDIRDARAFKGLSFRMHYTLPKGAREGAREIPLPIGKAGEGAEEVVTIDPAVEGKLIELANLAENHDDFLTRALEVVAGNDDLEVLVSASGPDSFYAKAIS